jgi:hypothetical protein
LVAAVVKQVKLEILEDLERDQHMAQAVALVAQELVDKDLLVALDLMVVYNIQQVVAVAELVAQVGTVQVL